MTTEIRPLYVCRICGFKTSEFSKAADHPHSERIERILEELGVRKMRATQ